jgi:hypothetical protein
MIQCDERECNLPGAGGEILAIELLRAGIAPRIIFSGRCSLFGPAPLITEAAAMAEYA